VMGSNDRKVLKSKTLFQHISGIKEKKASWESLSEMDKKTFTPFMVNRMLSMNLELLPIINDLQKYTVGTLSSREVYKLYLDFLPKRRTFDKYVKGKKDDKYKKELLDYLSRWYSVSKREVLDYLELLKKDEIIGILKKYGLTDREIKGLLK
jgi:hypothetical protein